MYSIFLSLFMLMVFVWEAGIMMAFFIVLAPFFILFGLASLFCYGSDMIDDGGDCY